MSKKPAPLLGPTAARSTLAHRHTRTADRLRQLNTRFGLRSERVFLVWTYWTGEERGEGRERILARHELLPTPRVTSAVAINRRPYAAGVFPEGSQRIDQVSCGVYTKDMLRGLRIPIEGSRGCVTGCRPVQPFLSEVISGGNGNPTTDRQVDFFYEIVEDGRGDDPSDRDRYRLLGGPSRAEGKLYWEMVVERASEELDRQGETQVGTDTSDQGPDTFPADEYGGL